MKKYLLDTHVLLWGLYNSSELSGKAIQMMSNETCFVSIATLWEIAIKNSLGKLALSQTVIEIAEKCLEYQIQIIGIKPEHCQIVNSLPFFHKDPFDRILVAQAQCEDMIIITRDEKIPLYDVKTAW